jgi:uncharacterized membrane protein
LNTNFTEIICIFALLLVLIGVCANVLMLVRARPGYRQYFGWSLVSLLLGLIPTVLTIAFFRRSPHMDPGNFVPFTFFAQIFFIFPAFVIMLMGYYLDRSGQSPNR